MCGIFALCNYTKLYPKLSEALIEDSFNEGKGRGPEFSTLMLASIDLKFGFHRLAINGINSEANQPININNVSIICNGEIYNYKELYNFLKIKPKTDSDCEIILHLYMKFGVEKTLQLLDGVFAFVLLDNNKGHMYVARDPYGVRSLYYTKNDDLLGFASEMSMIHKLSNSDVMHFPPGSYMQLILPHNISPKWQIIKTVKYHNHAFSVISLDETHNFHEIFDNVKTLLTKAVYKRCSTSDRPIACLLSGGLDSSLIAALVNQYHKINNLPTLETYCIGIKGSVDIENAEKVARFLGTKHTSVLISEEDFIDAIPEVIKTIESYDTTTVRASIGNYLIAKYISENSDAKVIFSGEGSDELTGGYLYMNQAPNCVEFDLECKRLLSDIHIFDVTRGDKCISSNGLEPRIPFLDRNFVQYYLSLPMNVRYRTGEFPDFSYFKFCEKFILRKSFESSCLLPNDILWRTKEAFSDGVSGQEKSLFEIIQDKLVDLELEHSYTHNPPKTKEQLYYRNIFEECYPNQSHIIPYFWMPRFVDANDPSARTLKIYKESNPELNERSL